MFAKYCAIAGLVLGSLAVLTPANGQDTRDRAVDQYQCRDIMRESGANRDVAIAFLHGFLLGKSGRQQFSLDVLHTQSEAFIERCLNSPTERAVDAMTAVKQ